MNSQSYNDTFAIMKGLAILSVVIGHVMDNTETEVFVNQYHLAVFFFVSGYFFKDKYATNFKTFAIRKAKGIYIPYLLINIACILCHNIFTKMHICDANYSFTTIYEHVGGVILMHGSEQIVGAMWFCVPLILNSLLFCIISRFTENKKEYLRASVIFAIALCSYLWIKVGLPSIFNIVSYIIVLPIIYFGYLFHKIEKHMPTNFYLSAVFVLVAFCLIYGFTIYGIEAFLQPQRITKTPFILIFFIGLIGISMIYCLSKLLSATKLIYIFQLLGDYSFSIMAFHFFGFKIVNAVMCMVENKPLSEIIAFPCIEYNGAIWFIAYVIIGCFFPILLSLVYHRCFPKFNALLS